MGEMENYLMDESQITRTYNVLLVENFSIMLRDY